jgi:CRISPR system Cascade subunit CasD
LPVSRPWHRPAPLLEDYHTVENARTASGGTKDTELTRRFYLQDAVFVALIQAEPTVLEDVAISMRNPVWGGWLGRRSCLPSLPLIPPGNWPAADAQSAWDGIRQVFLKTNPYRSFPEKWDELHRVQTAGSFADGTDTWLDMPENFQDGKRRHNARRVKVTMAGPDRAGTMADEIFPSPLDALDMIDQDTEG